MTIGDFLVAFTVSLQSEQFDRLNICAFLMERKFYLVHLISLLNKMYVIKEDSVELTDVTSDDFAWALKTVFFLPFIVEK